MNSAASNRHSTVLNVALALCLAMGLPALAESREDELQSLRQEVQELRRRDALREAQLERLLERIDELESPPQSGGAAPEASAAPVPAPAPAPPAPAGDLWSRTVGPASLRLLDIGLGVLAAAGSSSEKGQPLEDLQAGEHDPRQRGFTLRQAELSLQGAVDPFLRGDAFLIYFLDPEGESRFELEEAYATSLSLPFGLQDRGLQLRAGTFFTRFGRQNAQHPHQWHWLDQPVVLSRIFGGDGLRGPGFDLAWLTPLPWFSELRVGVQNSRGETQVSFLANDEVFAKRAIGGRPLVKNDVEGAEDLAFLVRWANGFDLGDSWSSEIGASGAFGPNATGEDARSWIYGADAVAKWRPQPTDRGWPFVILQGEILRRDYEADAFSGTIDVGGMPVAVVLPHDTLHDWGLYAQALWGFRRGWAAGLRYEYADGSGDSFAAGSAVSHNRDPFRARRQRVSPLLLVDPSEFARVRLQYNYDHAENLLDGDAHSVWVGLEISLGAHAAHVY